MPVNIVELDNGIGVHISGYGIVTDQEYVTALQKHLSQDAEIIQNYKYSLVDFTSVQEADVTSKSISLIANLCTKIAEILPSTVVGFVATEDHVFGLSRMWEMMADETNWEIMVFRDMDKAKYWIRERVNKKFEISELTFAE